MLVVTRKESQAIVIGDGAQRVLVRVLAVDGQRVKLGIEAAPEMVVLRDELLSHLGDGERKAAPR